MDSSRKTYFSTATSMISSLFGFVLWASRLPLTTQTPKQYPTHQNIHLGLKTLIFPEPANKSSNQEHHHLPHIAHSFTVSSSSQASISSRSGQYSLFLDSTPSWSSSTMGDLIGTDSGVSIMSSEERNKSWVKSTEISVAVPLTINKRSGNERICDRRKKEYPPPIPLLAQTGNLMCRMPWTLSRHCYPDGRLVLIGEKVKHHEYFECRRDDGRLVLNLVPLDNILTCLVDDDHVVREEDEEEEEEEMEMVEEDVQFADRDEEDEIEATHTMSDNEDEKGEQNGSYNLETITRCKRYGNLSKDFKSEGGLVDLESSWSSSSVSFGKNKNKYILHGDMNNFFVHPASAPLGPLMVSVM